MTTLRRRSLLALGPLLLALCASCSSTDDEAACTPDATLEASGAEVIELGQDHHRVESFILIEAGAADVWSVLIDFEAMPSWSTSFQGLTGDVQDGGEVLATYLVPDPATGEVGPFQFPHALRYEDGESFGWSDPIAGAPGLSDDHTFLVEVISDCHARFVQTDEFEGTDPAFTAEALAELSAQGYSAFNAELKAEVERQLAE